MRKLVKGSIVLGMALVLLGGCKSDSEKTTTKESTEQTEITSSSSKEAQKADEVSITVDTGENSTEKKVRVSEDENLLEIMKKEFNAEEEKGFITAINGVEQNKDENKYWVFTINGEQVNKGAQEVTLKKNDKVEWKLEKF